MWKLENLFWCKLNWEQHKDDISNIFLYYMFDLIIDLIDLPLEFMPWSSLLCYKGMRHINTFAHFVNLCASPLNYKTFYIYEQSLLKWGNPVRGRRCLAGILVEGAPLGLVSCFSLVSYEFIKYSHLYFLEWAVSPVRVFCKRRRDNSSKRPSTQTTELHVVNLLASFSF